MVPAPKLNIRHIRQGFFTVQNHNFIVFQPSTPHEILREHCRLKLITLPLHLAPPDKLKHPGIKPVDIAARFLTAGSQEGTPHWNADAATNVKP